MRLRTLNAVGCCLVTLVFAGCGDDSSTTARQQPSSVAELKDLVVSVAEQVEVDGTEVALQTVALQAKNPFSRRIPIPGEPFAKKSGKVEWLNTDPLTLKKLRGKFVVLDFWTYCCINCHHILPVLKKLEEKYPNEIVVIGVHSAKFDEEKNTDNIRDAILRHDIRHPVVNDHDHFLWNSFGVNSWPTLTVIDPEGFFVAINRGEIEFEALDGFFKNCIPYYDKAKLLDKTPIEFELEIYEEEPTELKYPGKVLADQSNELLYITDSSHNRIVISDTQGNVKEVIGSGQVGHTDGDYATASFDHPQGLALHENTLYVADVENHMIRKVDLAAKSVSTIAGIGRQASFQESFPGITQTKQTGPWFGQPKNTPINSPWALWVHEDNLYIAMAGPHQIWMMPLDESKIGPYAGNAREDIIDGPLLPKEPLGLGASSFAQPSGLTSDGEYIYVADSEGSSIRGVPLDKTKPVMTVVGTADLPGNRLFTFGDEDGKKDDVLLQHVLGVHYDAGKIYIADTYNNKIKVVDAKTGETRTVAGSGDSGTSDEGLGEFDEPSGLSKIGNILYVADTNNHLIRTIHLETKQVGTMKFDGLEPVIEPQ
ncbi:MAG: hypothetical protein CMJ76_08945 [Planctomycetaceae bacterium]|nr:hypothetical protein [Planctomycetaceae bacterium]